MIDVNNNTPVTFIMDASEKKKKNTCNEMMKTLFYSVLKSAGRERL